MTSWSSSAGEKIRTLDWSQLYGFGEVNAIAVLGPDRFIVAAGPSNNRQLSSPLSKKIDILFVVHSDGRALHVKRRVKPIAHISRTSLFTKTSSSPRPETRRPGLCVERSQRQAAENTARASRAAHIRGRQRRLDSDRVNGQFGPSLSQRRRLRAFCCFAWVAQYLR